MVSKLVKIKFEQGLHMRPAGVLASAMMTYDCDVTIVFNGRRINAKSVMNIIAGCIKYDSEILIECNGTDEQAALDKAVELVESGLGDL